MAQFVIQKPEKQFRVSRLSALTEILAFAFPGTAILFAQAPAGNTVEVFRAWFVGNPTGILINGTLTTIGGLCGLFFLSVLYRMWHSIAPRMKPWLVLAVIVGSLQWLILVPYNILLALGGAITLLQSTPPSWLLSTVHSSFTALGGSSFSLVLVLTLVVSIVSPLPGSLAMLRVKGFMRLLGWLGLAITGIGVVLALVYLIANVSVPVGSLLGQVWFLAISLTLTIRPKVIHQQINPNVEATNTL